MIFASALLGGCSLVSGLDRLSVAACPGGCDAEPDQTGGGEDAHPGPDAASGEGSDDETAPDGELSDGGAADARISGDGAVEGSVLSDAPFDAGVSPCASGVALPRAMWASNPGTGASDNACGTSTVANMFDGLLTTRWTTGRTQMTSPAEWVQIDLGCARSFSEVVLDASNDPTDYPRSYSVAVSSDANAWTQVGEWFSTNPLTEIAFPSTTARYIKVTQTGTATTYWSIDELNVCGDSSAECPNLNVYSRTGWATNSGTTASDDVADIGNIFDGVPSTRWTPSRDQSPSPVEGIEVDMGVSQPFSQVILEDPVECNDYPRGYTLEVSTDNNNWTVLMQGAASMPFASIVFPTTSARYIRIVETGTASWFWAIDELYVLH